MEGRRSEGEERRDAIETNIGGFGKAGRGNEVKNIVPKIAILE